VDTHHGHADCRATRPRGCGKRYNHIQLTDLTQAANKLGKYLQENTPEHLTAKAREGKTTHCETRESIQEIQASWRSSMAEQRFCKPQVGGSIPLASSRNSADDSTALWFTRATAPPVNSASVTVTVTIFVFPLRIANQRRCGLFKSASLTMLMLVITVED
jgi:hypothetical protein